MSATMTDLAPIEKVLAKTGWSYHKSTHGRYTLHYAIRASELAQFGIIEHKATTEAELLRRVWRYEDWKGL